MRQKLKILLVGIDESIPTAGEFKILLSVIDRSSRYRSSMRTQVN